jgi:hypothetical protein
VAAHVGLHALGSFADRLGLSDALSSVLPWRGKGTPLHDRGKVFVQQCLVLAGGGESCLDIEHLRVGADLFGTVPSDTTVSRTFHEIDAERRSAVSGSLAGSRSEVWRQAGLMSSSGPVVLDIDASLVDIHSEDKEETAPTFKGGFGFHPIFCFSDVTGEALSGILRPGNAGANTVADHISVLDEAIAQLPNAIAWGHRPGDNTPAERTVVVRADAAGCTEGFLAACRERNVGFFVTARRNAQVEAAIFDAIGVDEVWLPAVDQHGTERDGCAVAELTSLVDLGAWPEGTRLIVRREPLHAGAQRSLFPSFDYRYWGFLTDQEGDIRDLDVTMRAHAHVESHIQRLKDSGLCRFPFTDFSANATWMATVMMAADLVRWFQLLCLEGPWRDARPRALRWSIFHAPARLIHQARRVIVRIIDGWPTADVLLGAYERIAALT